LRARHHALYRRPILALRLLHPLQQHYRMRPADDVGVEAQKEASMKNERENGKVGYILAWAMGVPVSLLFLVFLLRGCT